VKHSSFKLLGKLKAVSMESIESNWYFCS